MIYNSIGIDGEIMCACIEGLLVTSASSLGTINLKSTLCMHVNKI